MNLNEMLNEVKPDPSTLGKSALPEGNYSFKIHTKEGNNSPFKLTVLERPTARGGRVAELGVCLRVADEELDAKYSTIYVSMPLVGIYDEDKNGNMFDTTQLNHSVPKFLAAFGMTDGAIGVADVRTGQAIDLAGIEARTKGSDVKPVEVYLTLNGESITESLLGKFVNAKVSYKEDSFTGKEKQVVKFTR